MFLPFDQALDQFLGFLDISVFPCRFQILFDHIYFFPKDIQDELP